MNTRIHNHRFWLATGAMLTLVLLVAFGAVQTARALEVDRDGAIKADEVIDDDVYIEAGHVVVDGTVNGALIVSAGEAEINGTVNGDLVMFTSDAQVNGLVTGNLVFGGQRLELNGAVGGSIFAAGSSLTLGPQAAVERNLVFGGFSLEAIEGSVVERDVHAGGYQMLLSGQVDQDVIADFAALEIEGRIGGDVTVTVAKPEPQPSLIIQLVFERLQSPGISTKIAPAGLRVDEGAAIAGTLTYKSPVEQAGAIQSSAIGEVVYEFTPLSDEPELTPAMRIKHWFVRQLRTFLTLFVLGALVAWRAPVLLSQLSDQARTKPLPSILWGLLTLCVIFFGLIALATAASVLGALFSVVTLGELLTTALLGGTSALVLLATLIKLIISYGTKLIVSYLIGKLILGRLAPRVAERAIWPLMLGIVLYVAVTSIPCLGDVIGFIVVLIGLGTIWLLIRQSRSAPGEIVEEASLEAMTETPLPKE
jgi:cytoskeletal protein CcmA (bactofilin family)